MNLKKGRKNFLRAWGIQANANRSSTNEERGEAEEPPPGNPAPENPEQQSRCLHHDFAEQHQFSFGWRARQLAPGDPALQDDLVQEMSLAVLQYEKPANFEFLLELAGNRAIDYLRYEARRGMTQLDDGWETVDLSGENAANLETLIEKYMERGVPMDWIEEVLGRRLKAA